MTYADVWRLDAPAVGLGDMVGRAVYDLAALAVSVLGSQVAP